MAYRAAKTSFPLTGYTRRRKARRQEEQRRWQRQILSSIQLVLTSPCPAPLEPRVRQFRPSQSENCSRDRMTDRLSPG